MERLPRPYDQASFLEVYRQTAEPLRRYAARSLGSAVAADDVVQEAYTRALASPNFPHHPQEARAYLFRVVSNLLVDHWRQRRRDINHEGQQPPELRLADPGLRIDLTRLFSQLKLQERQLIWLAHVEGNDHPTIARALGLSTGSVKVLLHRARQKFATSLRAGGYEQSVEADDDR
jgi:RNA polymerase sigma-70 factor (ECF subfamily)